MCYINVLLVKSPLGEAGGMAYVEKKQGGKGGVFKIKDAHGDSEAAIGRFMKSCGISDSGHTTHRTAIADTYLVLVKRDTPQKSGVQIHAVTISRLLHPDCKSVEPAQAEALRVAIRLARPQKTICATAKKKPKKTRSKAA
jgi:hypothetical protein